MIVSVLIGSIDEAVEVRINKALYERAEMHYAKYGDPKNGDIMSVCIQVKEACRLQLGYAPFYINYEDLHFTRLRDVPGAKKP